jgi:hypothetical protein
MKLLEIIEKLRAGLTDKEIAKLFDIEAEQAAKFRAEAVERDLLQYRHLRPLKKVSTTAEDRAKRREEVAKFIKAGGTIEDAAAKFRVGPQTIRTDLQTLGVEVPMKRQPGMVILQAYQAAKVMLAGGRDVDIAAKVGCSREWASKLREMAVKAGLVRK